MLRAREMRNQKSVETRGHSFYLSALCYSFRVGGESSHEGLVSHRSAVRSRDLRNDPDLSASNAAWSRTERRWGEGHHLRARPPSPAAGGKTRVSARATCSPTRLLILFERQRRYSEIGERLL